MSVPLTIEDAWRAAAVDLGLEIVSPFEVVLPSGARIQARVLVKKFGAEHGMLLVRSFTEVSAIIPELTERGYGFSVMDDPLPGQGYERQGMIEVLQDWGWSGPPSETPAWLGENP